MAPGRAESDFGPQGYIDTSGLKHLFIFQCGHSTISVSLTISLTSSPDEDSALNCLNFVTNNIELLFWERNDKRTYHQQLLI